MESLVATPDTIEAADVEVADNKAFAAEQPHAADSPIEATDTIEAERLEALDDQSVEGGPAGQDRTAG